MTDQQTATARDLVAAVLATLRAHFFGIDIQIGAGETTDFITDPATPLVAPWLQLHVTPVETDQQARRRPGRVPISYEFKIQCCLSTKTVDFPTELAEFASNVMCLVSAWEKPIQYVNEGKPLAGRRWGLGAAVDPPGRVKCYPGALNSIPHGHDALIVAWEQTLYRPERLTAADPIV
jgi:hypothetical protein